MIDALVGAEGLGRPPVPDQTELAVTEGAMIPHSFLRNFLFRPYRPVVPF